MVIFGHSYLRTTISRAGAAHSSPRRKLFVMANLGCVENLAEMAQTESIRTGGKAPALWVLLAIVTEESKGYAYFSFLI